MLIVDEQVNEQTNEYGVLVKCQWHAKTGVLGQKPVPVPLFQLEIPHGLAQDWTWTSEVTG